MRRLLVVATTRTGSLNRFAQGSLLEARNLKDFLTQTGEYRALAIYEKEKSVGPLTQWAQVEEGVE